MEIIDKRRQDKKEIKDKIIFSSGIQDKIIIFISCLVIMNKTR